MTTLRVDMDFAAAILMLTVFYVRPQEWIPAFQAVRTFMLAQVFALFTLGARPEKVTLKSFFQTPHDWMMLAYWGWIVWNSPTSWETFKATLPSFFLYLFIVQAVSTRQKLLLFLTWWGGMIYFIAFMAVASEYGFDPAGSYYISHAKGSMRLVFNNGMFDNPNALGHSVAPVISVIYFLMFWRRPIFIKEIAAPLWVLPFYCVYLTASKGAFISVFIGVLAALTFGRSKIMQILILVFAMSFGWGAMQALPRFSEVKWGQGRQDEAILGRLKSLEWGLKKLETTSTGIGWYRFVPLHAAEDPEFGIAPHNAYNMVGAELGYGGLFLFVGILYCCMRTIVTAKTDDVDEERIRRVLFVFTVSYIASGWVIDFAYRATFFMVVATVAALHRILQQKNPVEKTVAEESDELAGFRAVRASVAGGMLRPTPALAGAPAAMDRQLLMPRRPYPGRGALSPAAPSIKFMAWKRIGLVDLILIYICVDRLIFFWKWYLANA